MTTSYTNRLGTSPEEGTKAPCVTVSDANITLSGEQTVNSVAVVAGDRVLVGAQTDPTENGIYDAAAGQWTRATDFNLAEDVTSGVIIPVPSGLYKASFTGSFVPGTTSVTIEEYLFTEPDIPDPEDTENPKIAVLGASETVFPWSQTWVDHLISAFRSEGVGIDTFHTGAGAITHYLAMNDTDSLTGQTRAELTVARQPDVVIVELGLNDAILAVGGRTQAQMIADAQALYVYLATNLPNTIICYSRLVPYDEDQHSALPVTSIKKKYCVPYMHQYSTITGEENLWTSQDSELDQVLSSTMQDRLTNWKALDTAIQGFTEVDVVIDTNYFRPARLGLTSHDRVHPNSQGHYFIMSEVWKEFQTNTTLRTAVTELTGLRNLGDFTDFDITWESAVMPDSGGDGYDIDPTWASGTNTQYPMWINVYGNTGLIEHAGSWGNQQRPSIDVTPVVNRSIDQSFQVSMTGLWPGAEIFTKLWLSTDPEPTTWSSDVPARLTSKAGTHIGNDRPTMASGSYWIKYKVGDDVFGPFPIEVSGAYASGGGANAIARFRRTADFSPSTGWRTIILNSEVENAAPSAVSLNTSTGEITINEGQGYTHFKINTSCTVRTLASGVFVTGWHRNGNDQHDEFVGANALNSHGANVYPPLNFQTDWIPVASGGESIYYKTNFTASGTVQQSFGIKCEIELGNP
ncbi:MAG: hypothetical protein ABW134_11850 [Candidatus Thiodiazotropha endolucinida]